MPLADHGMRPITICSLLFLIRSDIMVQLHGESTVHMVPACSERRDYPFGARQGVDQSCHAQNARSAALVGKVKIGRVATLETRKRPGTPFGAPGKSREETPKEGLRLAPEQ